MAICIAATTGHRARVHRCSGLTNWRFEWNLRRTGNPKLCWNRMNALERSRRPEADDVTRPMRVSSELTAPLCGSPWPDGSASARKIALLESHRYFVGGFIHGFASCAQMLRDQLDYGSEHCPADSAQSFQQGQSSRRSVQVRTLCDVCVLICFQQDLATDAVGQHRAGTVGAA